MDVKKIKEIALQYRALLIENKVQPDIIILFGSQAKGVATKESDIDLAIVSRKFKKDLAKERVLLNKISHQLNAPLEVVAIRYKEYMKKETISPILNEIFKTGIVLF